MERFGSHQTRLYKETIKLAFAELEAGPDILGAKARDDLGSGIRTLHVARNGRKGRHLIVFRIGGDRTLDVLRLLHDGMDAPSHLSP